MNNYIIEFDKRSKALSKHLVNIASHILGFKPLLESAGLDITSKSWGYGRRRAPVPVVNKRL